MKAFSDPKENSRGVAGGTSYKEGKGERKAREGEMGNEKDEGLGKGVKGAGGKAPFKSFGPL